MAEVDLGRTDPESKGVTPTTAHGWWVPKGRELDRGLGLGLAEVIRPLAEVWRLLEVGLDDVVGCVLVCDLELLELCLRSVEGPLEYGWSDLGLGSLDGCEWERAYTWSGRDEVVALVVEGGWSGPPLQWTAVAVAVWARRPFRRTPTGKEMVDLCQSPQNSIQLSLVASFWKYTRITTLVNIMQQ